MKIVEGCKKVNNNMVPEDKLILWNAATTAFAERITGRTLIQINEPEPQPITTGRNQELVDEIMQSQAVQDVLNPQANQAPQLL